MAADLFTIGHSSHDLGSFFTFLQKHHVDALADVRSSPYSSRHPQFNRESIQRAVAGYGIRYVFLGNELGARSHDEHVYVDGKASYTLIATSTAFVKGLQRVKRGLKRYKLALMCAEKDPLACHRMILVLSASKERRHSN